MPRYTTLQPSESCSIYFDEFERKEMLGHPKYGVCDWLSWLFVCFIWMISLPVTWCFSFKIISQFERVVVFRLGRVLPLKGPGLIVVIPGVDKWKKVDMRMRAFKVPPQEVITIDRGILKVGGDVQYRIADPILALTCLKDMDQSLRASGHSTLNTNLSYEKLADIENEKSYLQTKLQNHMNKAVSEWGIEIARFELTHTVVIKGPGGVDPNQETNQEGAMSAITNLIKGLTSSQTTPFQMPGLIPSSTNSLSSIPQPISAPRSTNGAQNKDSPSLLKPEELFSVVKGVVNEELCAKIGAVYEFHIRDTISTNIWTIDLKNPPGCVIDGPTRTVVDVRFELSVSDFQKMLYGIVSPTTAYMNGSLVVDGKLQTAKKLDILVKKMKEM